MIRATPIMDAMSRITTMCIVFGVLLFAIILQTPPPFVKKLRYYYESSGRHSVLAGTTKDDRTAAEEPEVIGSAVRQVAPALISIEREMHLRNSPNGAIVGVVRKGDFVESKFEVSEGGRKWAFIKVEDQNLAGFLEYDSLIR